MIVFCVTHDQYSDKCGCGVTAATVSDLTNMQAKAVEAEREAIIAWICKNHFHEDDLIAFIRARGGQDVSKRECWVAFEVESGQPVAVGSNELAVKLTAYADPKYRSSADLDFRCMRSVPAPRKRKKVKR